MRENKIEVLDMNTQQAELNAYLYGVNEPYEIACKKFYKFIVANLNFHISQKYRAQKILDKFDILQILKKIEQYDTNDKNIVELKEQTVLEFEHIKQIIDKNYLEKQKILENEVNKVYLETLKAETTTRKILIENILAFKFPFDMRYKNAMNKHKSLKAYYENISLKYTNMKNSRPFIDKNEVTKLLVFYDKKCLGRA